MIEHVEYRAAQRFAPVEYGQIGRLTSRPRSRTCNPAPTASANSPSWTSRVNSVNAAHARLRAPVAAFVGLASPYLLDRQVPVGLAVHQRQDPARSSSVIVRGRQSARQPRSVSVPALPPRAGQPADNGWPEIARQGARPDNRHLRGPQLGERGVQDFFGAGDGPCADRCPDSELDSSPPPAASPRRSVDTNTGVCDHAL